MTVVSIRMTEAERSLVEAAAQGAHTSLSDFVRRNAIEAAELALMAQAEVVVPPEDWAEFEAFAREPARRVPALTELANARASWKA